MQDIDIINATTVLTDQEAEAVIAPLQRQLGRDYATVWGIYGKLHFVPKGAQPDPKHWWVVLLDHADMAGALGYHDVTQLGLPLGKVFVKTTMKYGGKWTVTLSHEVLEMLGDPDINLTVFDQRGHKLWAYEVCDACEADQFGYDIDGVTVSDFVYPTYFELFQKPGAVQFDYLGKITKPLELLPGGYMSYYDLRGGGWQQIVHSSGKMTGKFRAQVGARRERRALDRENWLVSTK